MNTLNTYAIKKLNKVFCISFLILLLIIISQFEILSQSVGIGTNSPNSRAQLEIASDSKGILIPRMTEAQRLAISLPPVGLTVYQTDLEEGYYYFADNGVGMNKWVKLSSVTSMNDLSDAVSIAPAQNQILKYNGSHWVPNADEVDDADADPTNEIELPTGGSVGQYLQTDGNGVYNWADVTGGGTDNDWVEFNGNVIRANGNVGVGVNSPTSPVHIKGGVGVDPLNVQLGPATKLKVHQNGGTSIGSNNASGTPDNGLYVTGNIGVGVDSPIEKLEVNGAITLGDASSEMPVAGTVRWNSISEDFEGYNGVRWLSLTSYNSDTNGNSCCTGSAPMTDEQEVTSSEGEPLDSLGYSVTIDGDFAFVGAPSGKVNGVKKGKVYVYEYDGMQWTEIQILTASDGQQNDGFGFAVENAGNLLLVGAPYSDVSGLTNAGKAYVFEYDGNLWSETEILLASDRAIDDRYGYDVTTDGLRVAVSAPHNEVGISEIGKVYIIENDGINWSEAETISFSSSLNLRLGISISINGDYIAIGVPDENNGGGVAGGSLLVYQDIGNAWLQSAHIFPLGVQGGFGESVNIDGDQIIVGNPYSSSGFGEAYIYRRSGNLWSQEAILSPPDGSTDDQFGITVGIRGNFAIIGANFGEVSPLNDYGKSYIYENSGGSWILRSSLSDANGDFDFEFGKSVATDGINRIIGSPGATVNGHLGRGKVVFGPIE